MHLLTWVGFGLIGYVPNTLYKHNKKNYHLWKGQILYLTPKGIPNYLAQIKYLLELVLWILDNG
jgi:hypothetical protein